MAHNPRYSVKFRRRREGKTDYKKRLALLKSRVPRFVVRPSNKYITCQFVEYDEKGDKTLVSVTSKKLASFGWTHSGKNLPACYLAGYWAGKQAKKKKIKKAVFDIGLQSPVKSKLFAALKGALDAGVEIPHSDRRLPSDKQLGGEHISDKVQRDFEAVKKKLIQKG